MAIANKFALALTAALALTTPTIAFANSVNADKTATLTIPEGLSFPGWVDTGSACEIPRAKPDTQSQPSELLLA